MKENISQQEVLVIKCLKIISFLYNIQKFEFEMQFSDIITNATKSQISPDGKYWAVVVNNKVYIKLLNPISESQTQNILNALDYVTQLIFSPDSQYILLHYGKKNIVEVFAIKGTWNCKIQDQFPGILNAIWAPDSRQILTFSDFQIRLSIYNLTDKSICYIKGPKFYNKGYSFSEDGKWLALAERRQAKDTIGIYFTKDWTLINYFQNLDIFDLFDLAWAPNSSFIVAWDNCLNYKLLTLCPLKGVINKYEAYKYQLGIKNVKYSHNSLFVAVGSFDEKIRLINALTWKVITQLQCAPILHTNDRMNILREEQYKQNSRTYTHLVPVDSPTIKSPSVKIVINQKTNSPPNQGIGLLEFSPDDYYIACRNDNMPNVLWIWDVSKIELKAMIQFLQPIKGFKWAPNQTLLCIYTGTPKLYLWNADDACVCDMPFQNIVLNVTRMKWGKDSKTILIQDKNQTCICRSIDGFRNN